MNCVVNGNAVQQQNELLDTSSLTMQSLSPQQQTQNLNYITNNNPNVLVESNNFMNHNLINPTVNGLNRQTNNMSKSVQNGSSSYLNHQMNTLNSVYNTSTFPVNLNTMIGDYVANSNLVLPGSQQQNTVGYK